MSNDKKAPVNLHIYKLGSSNDVSVNNDVNLFKVTIWLQCTTLIHHLSTVSGAFLCFLKFSSPPFHICFIQKSSLKPKIKSGMGYVLIPLAPSTLCSINKCEKCLQNVAAWPLFLTDFYLCYTSAQEQPKKKRN